MKQSNLLALVAFPFWIIFMSIWCYWTILKEWNLEMSSYGIFLLTAIYILVLEQIIPLKKCWKLHKKQLGADIKHFLFSIAPFDAGGKVLALAIVLHWQDEYFMPQKLWNTFPFMVSFVLANLLGEFLPYWYHRISHIGKKEVWGSWFLWKIHAIHHLPTQLNWFKTNWMHPINTGVNSLIKMLPLLVAGFSQEIIFAVGVLHIVVAYLSHANIKTQTGFLDYIVVTPTIHQLHHSKCLEEAQNFGNILPFWDLIFGTYVNKKAVVKEVGLVESTVSYPKEENYWEQLYFPFRK